MLVTYRFVLDDGTVVSIETPRLTVDDADRLCRMVRAIVLDPDADDEETDP